VSDDKDDKTNMAFEALIDDAKNEALSIKREAISSSAGFVLTQNLDA